MKSKNLIMALCVGAAVVAPLAGAPNTAYAGDSRPLISQEPMYDDNHEIYGYSDFRLEPSSVQVIEFQGAHYITYQEVELDDTEVDAFIMTVPGKRNWGSRIGLLKFQDDGSIMGHYYFADKRTVKQLKKELENKGYSVLANSFSEHLKNNLSNLNRKGTRNMFLSTWEPSKREQEVANYIKANFPSVVSAQMAYNKADAPAIAQLHKDSLERDALLDAQDKAAKIEAERPAKEKAIADLRNSGIDPDTYIKSNPYEASGWNGFFNKEEGIPAPKIDFDWLTHNIWFLTLSGPHNDWEDVQTKITATVRFKPFYFLNSAGEEYTDGRVMDMIPLYLDEIGGKVDASRSTSLLEYDGEIKDGNWWVDFSFLELYLLKHPDTNGEIGRVIQVGEGDRTVNRGAHYRSFLYHMRATSTTSDDFYFDQYCGDTPTGWSYHLTRITK